MDALKKEDLIKNIISNELGIFITHEFHWEISQDISLDRNGTDCSITVSWGKMALSQEQLEDVALFAHKYDCMFYPNHERTPGMAFKLSPEIIYKICAELAYETVKKQYSKGTISEIIIDVALEQKSVNGVPDTEFFRGIEELEPLWA